ncbi:MAG: hypothetical protein RIK87_27590 [Fuerstiella sp.]
MCLIPDQICLKKITALAVCVALCANAMGQQKPGSDRSGAVQADGSTAASQTADEVARLIGELGSRDFKTRQAATAALKAAGDVAIQPLRDALPDASLDQRIRIQSVLEELERNSFAARVDALAKRPVAKLAAGLPEWDRFTKLVGDDESAVRRYVQLLRAEPQLYAAALKNPSRLPDLLEARSSALLQTTRPAPVMLEKFTVDSYAALLLLAGNEANRLPRGTSTAVSALLSHPDFTAAVSEPDGAWYLRLAGSYILRGRIDVIAPLRFAREHRLPEGLTLARSVLQSALRGGNGWRAMMLIKEQGTIKDVSVLEAIFDNRDDVFGRRNAQPTRKQYTVCNGDLALAVAIWLRGEDPRDFGFPLVEDRAAPFRFAEDTTGFASEEDRQAARERYAAKFAKTGAKAE